MADRQITFEDASVGMAIPALVKKPTTVGLFMFAAAVWLTHRIHYDREFARSVGLKDIVVISSLQFSYLIQMINDWMGESGTIRKLSYRHHAPAFQGDVLTCSGTITEKRVEDGKGCLTIDLLIENQNKQKITSGNAIVYVPMGQSR